MLFMNITFWKALFYLSLGTVTLWLILKLSGIIHTPVWLEFGVPIAGIIIGIFSMYKTIIDGIHNIALKVEVFEHKFHAHDQRLQGIEQELLNITKRLTSLEHHHNP